MMPIFDKKEFYKKIMKDRLPVAKIEFPTETGVGSVEFIHTPIGVLLHICAQKVRVLEIKMYDKNYGKIALQNIFHGENLVYINDNSCVSVSNKIKIEDVIGRRFLIKLDNINVIARAEFRSRDRCDVDKMPSMVYN